MMEGFKDTDEIAEYREKVSALLADIDELHAAGAAAVSRHDEFLAKHKIKSGVGREILLSSQVAPADRRVFSRLFNEYNMMEERLENFEKSQSGSNQSIGARALGNRYRI